MPPTNLEICLMAIRATDLPNRGDAERDFIERYQLTAATTGIAMAESIAHSEVLHWCLQLEPEAAAYLQSHL